MSIMTWLAKVSRNAAAVELSRLKLDHIEVLRDRDRLLRDIRQSKEELEDLKLKKKIEEEDIKHLVKIRLEQQEIEFQKKEMNLRAEHERALEAVRKQYDEKLRTRLEEEVNRMKDMYGEVLKRLPNVNVRLKGDVSGT